MKRKDLTIKAVPTPSGYEHPPPPHDELLRHEFTLGLIAPKGEGKTTLACNYITFNAGYFHTIIWVSPTIRSDEKFIWLREQKVLGKNDDLRQFIQDLIELKDDKIVNNAHYPELQSILDSFGEFNAKIPDEHFIEIGEDLDEAEEKIREILEQQRDMIRMLEKFGMPKYLANRILVVADDLVGSKLFKMRGYFTGVNTRHRHYSLSMIQMTQGYKEIPKTIRTNWSAMIVYRIGNMKELEVIYEEYTMGLTWEQWLEAYEYCTQEEHGFMYLNYQKPPGFRIMKNFDQYLMVDKSE